MNNFFGFVNWIDIEKADKFATLTIRQYIKIIQEGNITYLFDIIHLKKWVQISLLIYVLNFSNPVGAESVKQCFPQNNFPGQSTENFWIQKAELKEANIHKELSKNPSSHLFSSLREKNISVPLQELKHGEGIVFSFREQFSGWPGLTDTSTLKYLTIHIPDSLVKNREIDLSTEKNIIAVVTEGSPSFRNFCFGYANKGKISIMVSNGENDELSNKMSRPIFNKIGEESVLMNIDLTLTTKNTNEAWPEQCGACILQGRFVLLKSSLTPKVDSSLDNPP